MMNPGDEFYDDDITIICVPAQQTDIPGVIITANCGHEVNVAASSLARAQATRAAGYQVFHVCVPCHFKTATPDQIYGPLTQAQIQEMLDAFHEERLN